MIFSSVLFLMALTVSNASGTSKISGLQESDSAARYYSQIAEDEHVVFFTTAASLDIKTDQWTIPIHGWIYEPANSQVRKAAIEKVFEKAYALTTNPENLANFQQRINLLLADNERGKRIVITLAGTQFELPESQANGHFYTELSLNNSILKEHIEHSQRQPSLSFSAVTKAPEKRKFSGKVLLIEPRGVSVISDIDDTVKITNVTAKRDLFEHTFFKEFSEVPDMAQTYTQWYKQGVSFHFVSSSPWQLYEPLTSFFNSSGFPLATQSLKEFRYKDSTLLNLFKKGTETKPQKIKAILDRYPNRSFVLIGDSGEQDPEVYVALMRERPRQIKKIFIRNVTGDSITNQRFSRLLQAIDARKFVLFTNTAGLHLPDTLDNP